MQCNLNIQGTEAIQNSEETGQGRLAHLCYPERTVYGTLSARQLEADFIGKKYLAGHSGSLNFVSISFKQPPKICYFYRVKVQTTDALLATCRDIFRRFEIPM